MDGENYVLIGCGNVGSKAAELMASSGIRRALVADTTGLYDVSDIARLAAARRGASGRRRLSEIAALPSSGVKRLGGADEATLEERCEGCAVMTALPTVPDFLPGSTPSLNFAALTRAKACASVDKSHVYPAAFAKLRGPMESGKYAPIGSLLGPCQVWDLISGLGIEGGEGIVNGTTNYIIWRMGQGAGFLQALSEAKEKGYADPHESGLGFGDLVGLDASVKMMVLARLRDPSHGGEIPVELSVGGKSYRVKGGSRFFNAESGEEEGGKEIYAAVESELSRIPALAKKGLTLRQVASIGKKGAITVSLLELPMREYAGLEGTLNRLTVRLKESCGFSEGQLLKIFDRAKISGTRANCSLERLGERWEVSLDWAGSSLAIQGPGAGAVSTATALFSACRRRAKGGAI